MRSESDGHCLPTSFPGLAVREALAAATLAPLVAVVANRYHPTVERLPRARRRAARARAAGTRASASAGRRGSRAVDGGFELDGDGQFAHVLVATGPSRARVPEELAATRASCTRTSRTTTRRRVAVVGAGMAAATEWLNALAAGAEVVSVRRREPLRRPLNVPRPYFSKRGLAGVPRAGADERATILRELSAPSYPPGRDWDEPLGARARGPLPRRAAA